MLYRFLILGALFCLFVFLQGTFFPHVSILGATPNLTLILICLVSFFSSLGSRRGRGFVLEGEAYNIALIIFAGFLFDFFSDIFFGASMLSLLIIYFFIKEATRFLKDIPSKYSILYFAPLLIFSYIIFEFLFKLFLWFSNHNLQLYFNGCDILVGVLYNLALAIIGFYVFKLVFWKKL